MSLQVKDAEYQCCIQNTDAYSYALVPAVQFTFSTYVHIFTSTVLIFKCIIFIRALALL